MSSGKVQCGLYFPAIEHKYNKYKDGESIFQKP